MLRVTKASQVQDLGLPRLLWWRVKGYQGY